MNECWAQNLRDVSLVLGSFQYQGCLILCAFYLQVLVKWFTSGLLIADILPRLAVHHLEGRKILFKVMFLVFHRPDGGLWTRTVTEYHSVTSSQYSRTRKGALPRWYSCDRSWNVPVSISSPSVFAGCVAQQIGALNLLNLLKISFVFIS